MADFVASATFQDNLSAGVNAATAALNKAADAADKLDATVTKAGPSATTLARRYDDATASAAKLATAQDRLRTATATMDAAVATGSATVAQRNAVVDALSGKVQALTVTTAAAVPVSGQMTAAHGQAAAAANNAAGAHAGFTRELIVLGDEVLRGNFSRIPGSMLVLSERSATMTSAIGSFISAALNPMTIAAVAAAGTLIYMGVAAETNARQMLTLQTQLRATRDDYTAMATEAVSAGRALAASSGFSVADSITATKTIASNPSFVGDTQQLQALAAAAGDLSAEMGTTLPEAATKLAAAMQDPAKTAQEWATSQSFGMTQAMADNIKVMQESGDKAGAFGLDLDTLKSKAASAANTSKTELQTALDNLGNAFTGTGADGKSFATVLGTYVTGAASEALNVITGIVNGINAVRVAINTPASAPSQSVLTNPISGDQGIFQLDPKTAAGFGVNPADANQNIVGGLEYIQQLLTQNNGAVDPTLKTFGGFKTKDPTAYINSVKTADTSVLNSATVSNGSQTMTTAQAIQFWGDSLGLDQKAIDLGMRIAVVESAGRQFGGTVSAASAVNSPEQDLPIPPIPPAGDTNGLANSSLVSDALKRIGDSTTISAAQNAAAYIKDDVAALAALAAQGDTSSVSVQKLNEDLVKQQVALQDAKTPADALVDSLTRQADGEDKITASYSSGMAAVDSMTNLVRAEEEARKMAGITTDNYAATVIKLAAGYDDLTKSQESNKAAAQIFDQGQQIQYLQEELSTLGETTAARARDLAVMKEQQTIQKSENAISDDTKNKMLANAAAIADMTTQLQTQQNAIQAVSGALTQVADQLGQAITDSFVSGTGAAVNWGNVTKAIIASVIQELLKLAIINPLINSLTGSNSATLGSVISVLGSSGSSASGGSSLLSSGSSLISSGSSINSLFGSNSIFSSTGLLGNEGGILGAGYSPFGAGGILSSGLSTEAAAQASAPLAEGAVGPVLTSDSVGTGAGALGGGVGGAFAGVGAGFAAGSLIGGFEQSALNKTGPAPEIGAGVGAVAGAIIGSVIPVVGTLIGGLIGGVIGGAGGGLIGPHIASEFSTVNILGQNGDLFKTPIVAQKDPNGTKEDETYAQEVADFNTFINSNGIKVSSQKSVVQLGDNTPGGFVDPTKYSDLNVPNVTGQTAFQQFGFTSSDSTLNNYLQKNQFADVSDFEAAVTSVNTFLKTTMPALLALGVSPTINGTLTSQISSLDSAFTQAIANAKVLGISTDDLSAAWAAATKQATAATDAQSFAQDEGFNASYLSAAAQISGNPVDALNAQLYAFDASASQQTTQLSQQLVALYGDSFTSASAYADQMALLEKSLGEQRLAIQQQYNDKITQTETTAVTSLASYVLKLQTGSTSPLSPSAQYGLASSQFNAVAGAAQNGDFNSYSNISTYADTLLSASQSYNGSGSAYTADFNRVLDVLNNLAAVTPDTLTASIYAAQMQTQTQQLQASLASLQASVDSLKLAVVQGGSAPSRLAS